MGKRLLAPFVLLALAGCGSQSGSGTTTAPPPTRTAAPLQRMALTVYRVDRGLLRPSVVHVPRTQAVAAAALAALDVDAAVSVADGTATVGLTEATEDETAEIVYTLTQFPSVQRVDVGGRTGLTRDDFATFVPPILVESPAAGESVPQAFRVTGTASVYEATLVVQAVRGGTVLEKQTVTASTGAPGRGTFQATLHATPGEATIQVFSPSAVDGSPQHEVDVAVTVTP